jgi:transcriptional regulator with XRE-family HTH domain
LERGKKDDPDARLAMILLRSLRYWDQAELAKAARIAPSQISIYDRGERAIPRDVLNRIAEAAGFPVPLLDPLLRSLRSFRAAASGRSRLGGRLFDEMYAGMVEILGEGLKTAVATILEDEGDFGPVDLDLPDLPGREDP